MEEGGFHFFISKPELKSLKYNLDVALLMFTLKNMLVLFLFVLIKSDCSN